MLTSCWMNPIRGLAAILMLCVADARGDVSVSPLFGDNMVLQRDIEVPVWGTADPGEAVVVSIGGQEARAVADSQGIWSAKLRPMTVSSMPQELLIEGVNKLAFTNVLVGDVWVCGGQSNMELTLASCHEADDVGAADLPSVRRFRIKDRVLAQPDRAVDGQWQISTPQTAGNFSAVGFYFARKIYRETKTPIGLLEINSGGTRIEPWTPEAGFAGEPSLAGILEDVKQRTAAYRAEVGASLERYERWVSETRRALATPSAPLPSLPVLPADPRADWSCPMSLYNGMVHPVVPFAIKGVLWYQGEANGGEEESYLAKMRALVGGWRQVWGQGEFPFYYVQLASYMPATDAPGGDDGWAGGKGWARTRSAQTAAMQIPHTGMASAIDVGDASDIHPRNKYDVGERLALWALRNEYGQPGLVASGPIFKSMAVEGDLIRIEFDWVGDGLMVGKKNGRQPVQEDANGVLRCFAIAGADKRWVKANAVIDGPCVLVSSSEVSMPVAVRYAFSMNPQGCNLYNKEGLPAVPFRTDDW